jgi:tRNA nucleotidyltransferase/poly(A) polymerase
MWNPLTNEILDPLNGIQDIHDKVLRTTRDADIVFAEDPVRIFRAIRFQRKLGFSFGFEITDEMIASAMASQNADRCRNEIAKITKQSRLG